MKVVGFGEILLRLSTKKGMLFLNSKEFHANYGGGEANVLISLSRFGIETRMITKVSKDQIGEGIINYLKEKSVETSFIKRENKRTPIYFVEVGSGNRSSKIIYDRDNSAFGSITDEDINIKEALKDADVFHFSGITLAISEEVRKVTLKILKYCKNNNILVSYDSNYRAKMWTLEEARKATKEILPYINIFSAGILDAENILDMSCDLEDKHEKLNYYYNEITKSYPNIKHIFSSIREIKSVSANSVQCNYYTNNKLYSSKKHTFDDIIDRIGAGDALTAGVIYSIVNKKSSQYTCEFATACSVLKHSIHGDANLVNIEEVENFISNGIGRISR
ncbi:2-dehydro-3-deoxygluconokinase [Clostridium sporogenes]|uniref:2-dehydro-3-deoxygluconokinase n=2 Tax=Clostridium TaxID=1485 RepID=A0AAE6I2R5_CLOSG|nr:MULTISPECIES: sugar kinase [Clostridium]EKS4343486.1 sugar kinase [Clostridium botulinum]MBE6078067.1 sugar kinase [Clostridium lundense]EDU37826.1 kinase, PfkB family [Clostridium sporogenes ATCC 15579]EKS4394531.1 sugar kinase [Clostridium botulinum]KIS25284.1 2-dehydro-3-deoxygluconokinase [Clostridium botulinum B2 450]